MVILFSAMVWTFIQAWKFDQRVVRAKEVDNNDMKRTAMKLGLGYFIIGFSIFSFYWIGLVFWRSGDTEKYNLNSWLWITPFCVLGPVALGLYVFYLNVIRRRAEFSSKWKSRYDH
jgi:hypothetical protein